MIYLDYNSTTPTALEVIDDISNCMKEFYANPASISHFEGIKAYNKLNECREIVAQFIGGEKEYLYFNSGASEANNTVFKSIADYYSKQDKIHIITSQIEHKCILSVCSYLERFDNVEISYIPVDSSGVICLNALKNEIKPHTKLISIMAANNETGVLQPLKEVSKIAHEHNILFHTDAAQIIGKIPFSIASIDADFVSISAHKFYGPNGVGAIYCKYPEILSAYPLIFGGGQEYGVRSGTVNVAGISGMTKAAELCSASYIEKSINQMEQMKQNFIDNLLSATKYVTINGDRYNSLPNTINLSFLGVKNSTIQKKLKMKLALSSASACSSHEQKPSHVLTAMGLNDDIIQGAIRLSFGQNTSPEELEQAGKLLLNTAERLRG